MIWPPGLVAMPASSSPSPSVFGTAPTAIRTWLPSMVRPSSNVTTTPSPTTVAATALARDMIVMPDSSNTACRTRPASSSSLGSTWLREDTSTTSTPNSL
jgi:hypothetical protein